MKIIVCIKQVPDTKGGVKFNPDGTLDRGAMLTIRTQMIRQALRQPSFKGSVRRRGYSSHHGTSKGRGGSPRGYGYGR